MIKTLKKILEIAFYILAALMFLFILILGFLSVMGGGVS